jgi:tetratricopeptide (TPR) repeat protein
MDAIRDARKSQADLVAAETHTQRGIALAGLGRLEEAEVSFRRVVALRGDAAGHNLLGAVLAAQEKWRDAIAQYQEAIRLQGGFAAVHGNLAEALRGEGRLEEAIESYHQALRLEPNSADTHYGLGNALRAQDRHAEAALHYGRALQLRPDAVEVLAGLATVLASDGRPSEAVAHARQALQLRPRSPAALFDIGTAFLKSGRFDEAVARYREVLRLRGDDLDTLNNLGTALWEQGRLDEAEASYRQAQRLGGGDFQTLNNLATALREQGRAEEAAEFCRQALAIRSDSAEALMNLAVILSDLGELGEAEATIHQVLQLRPDWAMALDNLGMIRLRQGKPDEALACFEQALRHQGDYAEAHRNRATVWLSRGDFERGWPEYEWRRRCRGRPTTAFAQPRWQGEDLTGRTILLHAEQGLGDTLQFIRYAPLVKQRGALVMLVGPGPLVRLLSSCPGIDRVIAAGSALPAFDVQAPLLSLPMILGTSLATVPAEVPYLIAAAGAVERRRDALAPIAGFRIGVAWQGNPRYRADRQRSFRLAALGPLARVQGVRLINLQKGAGTEQLGALGGAFGLTVLDGWEQEGVGDFPDTAAIMRNLDLVVTPDTALAHLAGGLGVRTWVALSPVADWRWLTDREDSPWYPTVRLFRQAGAGDWNEVFERMADVLQRELEGRQGK